MASRRIEEYFIHQRSENQQRLSMSDVLDVKPIFSPRLAALKFTRCRFAIYQAHFCISGQSSDYILIKNRFLLALDQR